MASQKQILGAVVVLVVLGTGAFLIYRSQSSSRPAQGAGNVPSSQETGTDIQPVVIAGVRSTRLNGYDLVPMARCMGFLDQAKPAPGQAGFFAVGGWAWDVATEKPPTDVVLTLADGTIAGHAKLGGSRRDVPKALPQVKGPDTGWNTIIQLPRGAEVYAFAVLADTKSACPVTNAFRVP